MAERLFSRCGARLPLARDKIDIDRCRYTYIYIYLYLYLYLSMYPSIHTSRFIKYLFTDGLAPFEPAWSFSPAGEAPGFTLYLSVYLSVYLCLCMYLYLSISIILTTGRLLSRCGARSLLVRVKIDIDSCRYI